MGWMGWDGIDRRPKAELERTYREKKEALLAVLFLWEVCI